MGWLRTMLTLRPYAAHLKFRHFHHRISFAIKNTSGTKQFRTSRFACALFDPTDISKRTFEQSSRIWWLLNLEKHNRIQAWTRRFPDEAKNGGARRLARSHCACSAPEPTSSRLLLKGGTERSHDEHCHGVQRNHMQADARAIIHVVVHRAKETRSSF